MNLVFLGPPGSGKGTQAARLADKLGMVHLSTGDVLREAVKNQTELGKKAEGYMKAGELVPDDLIVGLIEDKLKSGELNQGFILDGFPRTIPQAEALKAMLKENNVTLDKAMLLDVPDEAIVSRMSGRRFCPTCQTTYNVNVAEAKPKEDNKCDNDGTELIIRNDDQEEVVLNRLGVYHEQTEPIIDFYRNESILVEVNAVVAPDEVFADLLKKVNE